MTRRIATGAEVIAARALVEREARGLGEVSEVIRALARGTWVPGTEDDYAFELPESVDA